MSTECSLRAFDAPASEILSVSRGKLFHQPVRGSLGARFTLHPVSDDDGVFLLEHSSKTFISINADSVFITKERSEASPLLLRRDIFPSAVAFEFKPCRFLFYDKDNKRFSFRFFSDDTLLPTGCAFFMDSASEIPGNFFLKRPRQVPPASPPSKRMRPVSMALGPVLDLDRPLVVQDERVRSPSPIPVRRSSEAVQTEMRSEIVHHLHAVLAKICMQEISVQTDSAVQEGNRRSSGLMDSASVLKQVSDELFSASEENKLIKMALANLEQDHQYVKDRLQSVHNEKNSLESVLSELQTAKTSLEGEYLTVDRALARERSERLEYTRKTENILDKLRQELHEEKRKTDDMTRVKHELAMIDGERNRLSTEVARLNGEAVARDCEVFELEDTKRKMQQKIDQLARTQEELQTALSCYGELQRDHAQLKENLEFSLADNDEYKHKLASSLAKEQILNKELLRLNEALETTKDELTATTRKTQTLDAERRQLFMKTQEMDNLNTSLARLRDLSDDLRRQVDQHKTAKDQFERENRKLQAQVEQLFRELNDRQEKLEAAHKDLKKKEFLNDFKSRVVSGTTTSNKQQVRSHVEQAAPLDTTTESPSFLFKTALAPVPLPVQSATSVRTAEQASVSVSNHSAEHDENGARLGDSSSGDGGQLGDDGLGRAWKEAISRYPMNIKDLVSRKAGNSSEFLFGTKEVVCKQMGLNVTVQYGGENLLLPKFLDKYGYSESQKRRKSILQAAPNNNNSNKPAIKFKLKLANRKDYLSSNNNN